MLCYIRISVLSLLPYYDNLFDVIQVKQMSHTKVFEFTYTEMLIKNEQNVMKIGSYLLLLSCLISVSHVAVYYSRGGSALVFDHGDPVFQASRVGVTGAQTDGRGGWLLPPGYHHSPTDGVLVLSAMLRPEPRPDIRQPANPRWLYILHQCAVTAVRVI